VEGWRDQAMKVGRMITRIVLAFEAGRDGFWLARWVRARSIEPSKPIACSWGRLSGR
jgi:transposase